MPARGLLLALTVIGLCVLGVAQTADGGDCLRPPRAQAGDTGSLADLGAQALERLPWDVKVVRANLSAQRPMAVAAAYLMDQDLLIVGQSGLVYCMSRRDLSPRWVSSLKAPLAALPGGGATHYTFLVKAQDGSYWVHAFRKASGGEETGFPARLPFASSSGVANNASGVWIGSLGSPQNNRTVESVSLANGKTGWGWRTRGLLWASPVLDPSGNSLILAGEDGTVMSLPAGGTAPQSPNWTLKVSGGVTATPVVTSEHVVVGAEDGTLRCLELGSGEVKWLAGLDQPLRKSPWVLGGMKTVKRSTGVEGAPEIEVEAYVGIAFAHNRDGLAAFDLARGDKLFGDAAGRRPVCMTDRWVLTLDDSRTVVFRDAKDGYKVKDRLNLAMFDLIPANSADGSIFGITHDGAIVAAIPAP